MGERERRSVGEAEHDRDSRVKSNAPNTDSPIRGLSVSHNHARVAMSDTSLTKALQLVRDAVPALVTVYLFGSTATGKEHAGSDIDLAILAESPMDPLLRWELQERLAALLHRDVDLVDLQSASTVMRVQVLDGSRVLVDVDSVARQQFEMRALSAYALLNEERRAILDEVHQRGRVYDR